MESTLRVWGRRLDRTPARQQARLLETLDRPRRNT
jgi:hypothetical protein